MKIINWSSSYSGSCKLYSFVNLYSYLELRNRDDLGEFLFMSDGILICLIARLFGRKLKRYSFDMTSLAPTIFSDTQSKFAVVGSTKKNIDVFTRFLNDRFEINPCFVSSGYFEGDSTVLCCEIVNSGADVAVVGLGTPLQEEFLLRLSAVGYKGIAFTCGGFITQTASAGGEYYPRLIDKMNLRFLYRMCKEPHTIKRYLFLYPKGAALFIYDLLVGRHEFILKND